MGGFFPIGSAPATPLLRPSHTPTTTPNTTMSAVTMNAITVKASAFTAGRVSLRAKSAVAAKPRGMTVMAYKVTLETPEGTQEIECADDTYVLDAAEVRRDARRTPRPDRDARRSNARTIASDRTRADDEPRTGRDFPSRGSQTLLRRYDWIASRKRVAIERAVERRSPPDPIPNDSNPTGGRHRPALLVPRGRVLVLRGQGHRGYHRPVRPVLPRRRPDGRRLHPHLRRLPHLRLHHQDPHGTSRSLRNAKIHSLSKVFDAFRFRFFFSRFRSAADDRLPFARDVHRRRSSTKRPRASTASETGSGARVIV